MSTTPDLSKLIARCHDASKASGWWEPRPDPAQQLMLVVSELAEALEGGRNHKAALFDAWDTDLALIHEMSGTDRTQWNDFTNKRWEGAFRAFIKDTPGDELADAYIRLLDWAGGFALDRGAIDVKRCDAAHWVITQDTFGGELLICVEAITDLSKAVRQKGIHSMEVPGLWVEALTCVEVVARQRGIDLLRHVDLKLQYNATRGQKHGNKKF